MARDVTRDISCIYHLRAERDIDKGYAWVALAGAFCVQMIAAMLTYSPGVINIVILQEVDNDLVKTSWIGSTLYGTFTLMGPVAGLVYKKFGPRLTTVVGGIIVLLGMTTASFCSSVVGLILTYGLTTGLGMCLGGNVVGVVPGEYFIKRRSVAYGITMSGGAVGLFIAGPLLRFLLQQYGLKGTLLLFGAVASHVCVAGMLFWKQGPVLKQRLDKTETFSSGDDVRLKNPDKVPEGIPLSTLQKTVDLSNGDAIKVENLDHTKVEECLFLKCSEKKTETNIELPLTDMGDTNDDGCIHPSIDQSNISKDGTNNVSICDVHIQKEQHCDLCSDDCKCYTYTPIDVNQPHDTSQHDLKYITKPGVKSVRKIPNKVAFLFYNISIIFWSLGESSCMFHLPNYVQSKGSTFSQASIMFTAVGAGGIFARIVTGLIASDSSIGYTTLHVGLAGISGSIVLLFPLYSHTFPLQVMFSVLYGVYNQGINALMSPITISFVGLSNVALGFGVVYFSSGFGFLTGPPIASAIYQQSGSYDNTFIFSGACLLMSSFSTAVAHIFAQPIGDI